MHPNLELLYQALTYQFTNITLLNDALSHRSAAGNNNERLEFLGDSILNFIIAEALFQRFPKTREGDLTRIRAGLVNGETLAEIANQFSISNYMRLGMGELKSDGKCQPSILADAMEAIIGAIYLDAGFARCQEVVLRWYETRLTESEIKLPAKDSKTYLQEYLQSKKYPLPEYKITKITGEAHEQVFHIRCTVDGLEGYADGSGKSRRRAEQKAAENYLRKIIS